MFELKGYKRIQENCFELNKFRLNVINIDIIIILFMRNELTIELIIE